MEVSLKTHLIIFFKLTNYLTSRCGTRSGSQEGNKTHSVPYSLIKSELENCSWNERTVTS